MAAIGQLGDDSGPVVITRKIDQAYIDILFHDHYPPALVQREGLQYDPAAYPLLRHPHVKPIAFDRYIFDDPDFFYRKLARGVFVFVGNQPVPQPPIFSVRLPDGRIAYQVVVKDSRLGGRCSPGADLTLEAGASTAVCSFTATTPATGGPWHAFVTWDASLGTAGSQMASIRCALDDGTNQLAAADTLIPAGKPRTWHVDATGSSAAGTYSASVAKIWTWRCQADHRSALFATLSPHGTSHVELDFTAAPESARMSELARQMSRAAP